MAISAHTKLLASTLPRGVMLVLGQSQPRFTVLGFAACFVALQAEFPNLVRT